MEADSGETISELRVDGGAAVNNFLMQFQADILGKRVVRPADVETTALGAAYLAGIAEGVWSGAEEVESFLARRTLLRSANEPRSTPGAYRRLAQCRRASQIGFNPALTYNK